MIKLTDKLYLIRSRYSWDLVEITRRVNSETGEESTTRKARYYTNIDNACESAAAQVASKFKGDIIDFKKWYHEEVDRLIAAVKLVAIEDVPITEPGDDDGDDEPEDGEELDSDQADLLDDILGTTEGETEVDDLEELLKGV